MNWWQAIVMGIVEGLTEYLPVSSTGHLILAAKLLGLDGDSGVQHATNTFNIIIQVGAIVAVLGLYPRRVGQMCTGLFAAVRHCGPLCGRPQPLATLDGASRIGFRLALNLLVAFLPAAVLGPLLDDQIKQQLMRAWPVIAALFIGGCGMILISRLPSIRRAAVEGIELDGLTWKLALAIGVGQCLAMWPGTSRSMMTIVVAMLLGVRPRAAAEFSFLLGLVTLGAATAYTAVSSGQAMLEQISWDAVALGLIVAAISAAVAMKFFVAVLVRYGMAPFGWYRIALACGFAILLQQWGDFFSAA